MPEHKINFVYTAYPHLGSAYFGTHGLKNELERTGRLNYSVNTMIGDVDVDKLGECPTLFMNGHTAGMEKHLISCGDGFKANIFSESFYTRHGKEDTNSALVRAREKYFDLSFVFAETDTNIYRMETKFISPWADTNVLFPMDSEYSHELTFIGSRLGREDFLSQDKKGIIKCVNTELDRDAVNNAVKYSSLMSKRFHLVNPPARQYNGVAGRMWEILACNRLCYQYYNHDTMKRTLDGFKDCVVLFSSMDELIEKYNYYLKHHDKALEIAERGYQAFINGHTQAHRAKYISDTILEKALAKV
jgi:hypothetical protein